MGTEQEKLDWLKTFRAWFEQNKQNLDDGGIKVDLPAETLGSGIYADLKNDGYAVTIQLWSNGLSDFHIVDLAYADNHPNYDGEVAHYEFAHKKDLFAKLSELFKRISGDIEPPFTLRKWPVNRYMETAYVDPSSDAVAPVSNRPLTSFTYSFPWTKVQGFGSASVRRRGQKKRDRSMSEGEK